MGRPTKIEGNPDHPSSASAPPTLFMQASILGLYDPDRSQVVRKLGEIRTWSEFIAALQPVLDTPRRRTARGLRILTQTITSPTLGAQIQQLLDDGIPACSGTSGSRSTATTCARARGWRSAATSTPSITSTRPTSWSPSTPTSSAAGPGISATRATSCRAAACASGTTSMNRLYAIESTPTQHRRGRRSPLAGEAVEIEAVARAALRWAAGAGAASSTTWIAAIASDLQANRGASIVIAGDEQPPVVHAIAMAINQQLGNIGTTVTITDPVEAQPVNQLESLRELVDRHERRHGARR